MGAIAGLFHPATPKPVDPARVRAMALAMAHRGPDGAGEWTAPGVGFAHRRLAVIGGAAAVQPVATPDLRYALMLDGTILNHADLREELRALGQVVPGEGDAEVLLHGFAAWGPSLLDRLEGAFVFAVHDAATQTLFLARDRLGAKPLFHATLSDGALAFASELRGLLAHPLLRGAPDVVAIDDYLALGYVPDDGCVVAGVQKLPAGHFLLIERGRPARPARAWWRPSIGAAVGVDAVLPAARRVIGEAARGVAPVALLDGGVADAAVVALLAEASARAVPTVAETEAAAITRRFATAHRATGMPDVASALPLLAAAFDEPCAVPGALTALLLAGAARERATSVVSGIGAVNDEAGLQRFARRQRWREKAGVPAALRALLGAAEADHAAAIGMMPREARRGLFASGVRRALADHRPEARFAAAMRASGADDPLDRALYATLAIRLPARDLAIADRAGMAAGVEWRAPFADHRFVGVAAGVPRGVRAGRTSPLATALAHHLPPLPAAASPLPVAAWLRGPLAEAVAGLARSRLFDELGWFDRERLAQLAEQHRGGQADHAVVLWRLLILERCLSRLFGWPAFA